MHVKGLEEQVRLVAHALSQAFELGLVKVVLQNGSVVWVSALLDDFARPFARRHASDVGQALGFLVLAGRWEVSGGRLC